MRTRRHSGPLGNTDGLGPAIAVVGGVVRTECRYVGFKPLVASALLPICDLWTVCSCPHRRWRLASGRTCKRLPVPPQDEWPLTSCATQPLRHAAVSTYAPRLSPACPAHLASSIKATPAIAATDLRSNLRSPTDVSGHAKEPSTSHPSEAYHAPQGRQAEMAEEKSEKDRA